MSSSTDVSKIWIARDFDKCSGCRMCEVACSLHHEGRIWPEASRVRVFMLIPGIEIPHLCTQCTDHPCVESCPLDALSKNNLTGAIIVDKDKCTACGICSQKCPGRIPHLHPNREYVVICDLCYGDPKCAKICERAKYNALRTMERSMRRPDRSTFDSYTKTPEEITKDLAKKLYGDKAAELM